MQHKAVYLLFCKFTLHVSVVNHTHHEYTKPQLQPPVLVIFFVQLPPSNVAKLGLTRSVQYYPPSLVYVYHIFSSHRISYQFPQCVPHVQLTLFIQITNV